MHCLCLHLFDVCVCVCVCVSGALSWTQWRYCVSGTGLCREAALFSTASSSRSNFLNSPTTQVISSSLYVCSCARDIMWHALVCWYVSACPQICTFSPTLVCARLCEFVNIVVDMDPCFFSHFPLRLSFSNHTNLMKSLCYSLCLQNGEWKQFKW